ncbi:Glucan 1,3-beta-glucosidase 3 [Tulasnella sp. 403]|nr:Glucan 1,3-beta-glucosidase 3 [Tulasnella sp. 403]
MKLLPLLLISASLVQASSPISSASLLALSKKRGILQKTTRANCKVPNYNPGPIQVNLEPFDINKATIYRYRKQQSVNLGSLFVHEQWMVPSVFECADGPQQAEIDIAKGWGGVSKARAVLEKHWDTFITEDDFAYLQKIGINNVRLPIGFWSLGPDWTKNSVFEKVGDVYQNSWPRVLRTIGLAGKYGIGVLIDLHGAYGSQNGQAHSGISDGQTRLFDNEDDQQHTIDALVHITQQTVNITNVSGIQILNEPQNADNLGDFYDRAIEAMRKVPGAEQLPLVVHDAFNLGQWAKYIGKRDDFSVVDHHSYFVFTPDDQSTPVQGLTSQINTDVSNSIASASKTARGNLITDEWGCALADGSTKVDNLDSATRDYCEAQLKAYTNHGAGHAFWSYMKEDCDNGWCFKGAVGSNLPKTLFSYTSQKAIQPENMSAIVVGGNQTAVPAPSSASSSPVATSTSGPSCKAAAASRKRSQQSRRRHHQRNQPDSRAPQQQRSRNTKRNPADKKRSSSSNVKARSPESKAKAKSKSRRADDVASSAYSDGQSHAMTFYGYGTSKIGFKLQYVQDWIKPNVSDQDLDTYTQNFLKGVTDMENQMEDDFKKGTSS